MQLALRMLHCSTARRDRRGSADSIALPSIFSPVSAFVFGCRRAP